MYEVKRLTGLRWLEWILFRFWHITLMYRWAMDPDKYDFQTRIVKENVGVFYENKLVGGVRLIFPHKNLEETLSFGEPAFASMVKDCDIYSLLQTNLDLIVEATRFLVRSSDQRSKKSRQHIRQIFRGLYQVALDHSRPLVLIVVNENMLKLLCHAGFSLAVIGLKSFPPKNAYERAKGKEQLCHYMVVVNLVESAKNAELAGDTFYLHALDTEAMKSFHSSPQRTPLDNRLESLWCKIEGRSVVERLPCRQRSRFIESSHQSNLPTLELSSTPI